MILDSRFDWFFDSSFIRLLSYRKHKRQCTKRQKLPVRWVVSTIQVVPNWRHGTACIQYWLLRVVTVSLSRLGGLPTRYLVSHHITSPIISHRITRTQSSTALAVPYDMFLRRGRGFHHKKKKVSPSPCTYVYVFLQPEKNFSDGPESALPSCNYNREC